MFQLGREVSRSGLHPRAVSHPGEDVAYYLGQLDKPQHCSVSGLRIIYKQVCRVHGRALGITARTEHGVEFSAEQARQYYDRFFNTHSGLRGWHQSARSSAAGLTYGATPYGRKRRSDIYQSLRDYRSACERAGKSGKQIERCVISTFQVTESMGFKHDFRHRGHLLRVGD